MLAFYQNGAKWRKNGSDWPRMYGVLLIATAIQVADGSSGATDPTTKLPGTML